MYAANGALLDNIGSYMHTMAPYVISDHFNKRTPMIKLEAYYEGHAKCS